MPFRSLTGRWLHGGIAIGAAIGASLVLAGCSGLTSSAGTAPVQARQKPLQAHAYGCDGDMEVVVERQAGTDSVYLFLPASSVYLDRVASASGATYRGEDGVTFSRQGDEARLVTRDGRTHRCREHHHRSLIEDAKLRGVDFWASGFEPGWTLEIGPERTLLVTDYGDTRAYFPTPDAAGNPGADATEYHLETEAHTIDIAIHDEPCRDASGRHGYPASVRIDFDGETLRGCGMALH